MKKPQLLAIAASSLLSLSACAGAENSPMDTGERISQRGSQIGQYGDAWSAGQEDVVRGEREIASSNRSIERAETQIADARQALEAGEDRLRAAQQEKGDAERLIAAGNQQMERAEEDYEAVRAGPSAGD